MKTINKMFEIVAAQPISENRFSLEGRCTQGTICPGDQFALSAETIPFLNAEGSMRVTLATPIPTDVRVLEVKVIRGVCLYEGVTGILIVQIQDNTKLKNNTFLMN